MKMSKKRIGEILIEKGFITEAQLKEALEVQKSSAGFLGNIMVDNGWISKDQLSEALAEQFGIPLVELKSQHVDMELLRRFSSSLILDYQCFPLSEDENSVTVAIVNPLDAGAISKIEDAIKPRRVNLVMVAEEDLEEAIQNYRQGISDGIRRLLKKEKNAE